MKWGLIGILFTFSMPLYSADYSICENIGSEVDPGNWTEF